MSTLTFAHANREHRVSTTGTTTREKRIEEAAEGHLRRSSYLALRDIGCTCREGVVTIRGCLPTHYLKQIAQHVVTELEGVCGIVNQIEVLAPPGRDVVGSGACA